MSSLSQIGAISASGLSAASTQVAVAATNIANAQDNSQTAATAPFGSSTVVATPTSGTQPTNAASQVFQALNVVSVAQPGGGVDTSISQTRPTADGSSTVQPVDIAQQLVTAATAQHAFAANVATQKASENLSQTAINFVT